MWFGVVWFGKCDVVWCGVVRCGMVWCGVVRCVVVWCGLRAACVQREHLCVCACVFASVVCVRVRESVTVCV